jgi:hypothetical protein
MAVKYFGENFLKISMSKLKRIYFVAEAVTKKVRIRCFLILKICMNGYVQIKSL